MWGNHADRSHAKQRQGDFQSEATEKIFLPPARDEPERGRKSQSDGQSRTLERTGGGHKGESESGQQRL